jgi:hypothetical protein
VRCSATLTAKSGPLRSPKGGAAKGENRTEIKLPGRGRIGVCEGRTFRGDVLALKMCLGLRQRRQVTAASGP